MASTGLEEDKNKRVTGSRTNFWVGCWCYGPRKVPVPFVTSLGDDFHKYKFAHFVHLVLSSSIRGSTLGTFIDKLETHINNNVFWTTGNLCRALTARKMYTVVSLSIEMFWITHMLVCEPADPAVVSMTQAGCTDTSADTRGIMIPCLANSVCYCRYTL